MITCKECKYFEKNNENFGFCNSDKFTYLNRYCQLDDKISLYSLIYRDGDDYNSEPLVGINFGCIHGQIK